MFTWFWTIFSLAPVNITYYHSCMLKRRLLMMFCVINNFDSATKIERSCCRMWLKGCYKGPVALTPIRSNTILLPFRWKTLRLSFRASTSDIFAIVAHYYLWRATKMFIFFIKCVQHFFIKCVRLWQDPVAQNLDSAISISLLHSCF